MKKILLLMICMCFSIYSVSCISMAEAAKFDNENAEKTLRNRAGFEMSCPEDKLKLTVIEKNDDGFYTRIGIAGCGKRGMYMRVVNGGKYEWILNSTGN